LNYSVRTNQANIEGYQVKGKVTGVAFTRDGKMLYALAFISAAFCTRLLKANYGSPSSTIAIAP